MFSQRNGESADILLLQYCFLAGSFSYKVGTFGVIS